MKMECAKLAMILGLSLALIMPGCQARNEKASSSETPAKTAASQPAATPASLLPATPEPTRTQTELLKLAYQTAAAIPVKPHLNDQAKSLEAVVEACIACGQIPLAEKVTQQIPNWRKGIAAGELAAFFAKRNEPKKARLWLSVANQTAKNNQGWRKDRINVKMAQVQNLLGQQDDAQKLLGSVTEDSEKGKLTVRGTEALTDEAFKKQMASFKQLLAKGNFDITLNVLMTSAELYAKEFPQVSRRELLDAFIRGGWAKTPLNIRVNMLVRMAQAALDHHDPKTALHLVNDAQTIVDSAAWSARHGVPIKARIAKLRFTAGDRAAALKQVDAFNQDYQKTNERTVNIYRAGILRSIAEAYQTMGQTEKALAIFKQAVREGVVNPNSRPRALDLAATCNAMAVNNVTPDSELWETLRQIRQQLGQPW